RTAPLFFFQAEDGIRDFHVTGVQTCALPISRARSRAGRRRARGRRDGRRRQHPGRRAGGDLMRGLAAWLCLLLAAPAVAGTVSRSEERRVGKEWRSRRAPYSQQL